MFSSHISNNDDNDSYHHNYYYDVFENKNQSNNIQQQNKENIYNNQKTNHQPKQSRNPNPNPTETTLQNEQKLDEIYIIEELKENNCEKTMNMFKQLRKQLKTKDNQITHIESENEELHKELQSIKKEYGKCLNIKNELSKQNQELIKELETSNTTNNNLQNNLNHSKNQTEDNNYYKLKLIESKNKLKNYNKRLCEITSNENSYKTKLDELRFCYEENLHECEEEISSLESSNWYLKQENVKLETELKKLKLLEIENNDFNYQMMKYIEENKEKEEELMFCKLSKLEKEISKLVEKHEFEKIELENCLELERFKVETYYKHIKSLEERDKHKREEKSILMNTNQQVEGYEELEKKWIDLEILLKEIIEKLKKIIKSFNIDVDVDNVNGNKHNCYYQLNLLEEYLEIWNNKFERINNGKEISFLKNDTKDFITFCDEISELSDVEVDKKLKYKPTKTTTSTTTTYSPRFNCTTTNNLFTLKHDFTTEETLNLPNNYSSIHYNEKEKYINNPSNSNSKNNNNNNNNNNSYYSSSFDKKFLRSFYTADSFN